MQSRRQIGAEDSDGYYAVDGCDKAMLWGNHWASRPSAGSTAGRSAVRPMVSPVVVVVCKANGARVTSRVRSPGQRWAARNDCVDDEKENTSTVRLLELRIGHG